MATILITGASGLIGTALSKALLAQGHVLHHLGRDAKPDTERTRHFQWNIHEGSIDPDCVQGVTHIVHLAGAGIADKRWSKARLTELIDSRTASSRLLLRTTERAGARIETMVSAAGINYYGAATSGHVSLESDPPGTDTIAHISVEWERAVDEWAHLTRVVKLRTPIVLSSAGGALPKLAAPVRWGIGAALGTGRQWMPWVHIDDLVRIYIAALFDQRFKGAYNVNTGHDVTNGELMRSLARALGRPHFLPAVPSVVLRLALGELSTILLGGSRASNKRLLETGFKFHHPMLQSALADLLR